MLGRLGSTTLKELRHVPFPNRPGGRVGGPRLSDTRHGLDTEYLGLGSP